MQSLLQLFRTVANVVIVALYVGAGAFTGMAIGAAYLLLGAQAHGGVEHVSPADFASATNVSMLCALGLASLGFVSGLRRVRSGNKA